MPQPITPAITFATNSTTQNLFTISQVDGVTSYGSQGTTVVIALDTAEVAVGTDVSYNTSRGEWSLAGSANIAYTLSASVTTNNVDPASTYGWYNVDTGNVIGVTATVGTPLSVSYLNDTGSGVTVSLALTNASGEPFQYPAQVVNASATVTEVSGYSVA